MKLRKGWFTFFLAFSVFFVFSFWTPHAFAFTEEQKLVLESWRIVNQAYVDESFNHQNWWSLREKYLKRPLTDREKAYNAIEEMLAVLDDPFTRLLRPQQYRSLQITTSGELSGVGLQINIDPETGDLEVISPIAGSPAQAAGIQPRDRILEINGTDTHKLTLDEAAARMRGPVGTKVSLTIQSYNQEQTRIIDLIRDRISLNSVATNLDQQAGIPIGYIRLSQFSANSAAEIAHGVAELEQKGAKAYILDLRNNPGGLLQSGIEIARLWLHEGTIVYTVNRQGILGNYDSDTPVITEAPLVVLVNQGTASASEILAGALQDNQRAVLIGEKTFGKGLIQSLFDLSDGAGLAVTVAKYETPNHRDINKLGIIPDQIVSQDPISITEIGTEKDQQYQAALKVLSK